VFPQTVIHQWVVYLVRQSLQHLNWKERKLVASQLRAVVRLGAPRDWQVAMHHIALLFGTRLPVAE